MTVKTIYGVRHAQSTHNAKSFAHKGYDTNHECYIDSELTPHGMDQAKALAPQVLDIAPELIVVSPMIRTAHTAQLACAALPPHIPTVVSPLCAERMGYSCDVGSPVSVLQDRFPNLDYSDVTPAESWWWTGENELLSSLETLKKIREHPAGSYIYGEPLEVMDKRVADFKEWLIARPEKKIIFFSHACYLGAFFNVGHAEFKNTEVREYTL